MAHQYIEVKTLSGEKAMVDIFNDGEGVGYECDEAFMVADSIEYDRVSELSDVVDFLERVGKTAYHIFSDRDGNTVYVGFDDIPAEHRETINHVEKECLTFRNANPYRSDEEHIACEFVSDLVEEIKTRGDDLPEKLLQRALAFC